jgi:hypothetical protein
VRIARDGANHLGALEEVPSLFVRAVLADPRIVHDLRDRPAAAMLEEDVGDEAVRICMVRGAKVHSLDASESLSTTV